jgi:hypothetical protein
MMARAGRLLVTKEAHILFKALLWQVVALAVWGNLMAHRQAVEAVIARLWLENHLAAALRRKVL